ncbi:hypothetical protein DFJ77DRAFT_450391, partial [Powellomyces hirtus]
MMSLPPSPMHAPVPHIIPGSPPSHMRSLSKLTVHVFLSLFRMYSTSDPTAMIVFVNTFLSRMPTKPTVVFLALKYLAGCAHSQDPEIFAFLKKSQLQRSRSISLDPLLLMTAAVAMADGFLNDAPYSAAHYAYATGLSRSSIVDTKRMLFQALNWDLNVLPEIYGQWVLWLKEFALRSLSQRRAAEWRRSSSTRRVDRHMATMVRQALLDRMTQAPFERMRNTQAVSIAQPSYIV